MTNFVRRDLALAVREIKYMYVTCTLYDFKIELKCTKTPIVFSWDNQLIILFYKLDTTSAVLLRSLLLSRSGHMTSKTDQKKHHDVFYVTDYNFFPLFGEKKNKKHQYDASQHFGQKM